MSNSPLVSVYIPTHKRPNLAKRAIDSVLKQTYAPVEIVLCNDGSGVSDYLNLKALVEDNGGQYLVNEKAMGAPYSRNKAINCARGKYITGLDDDDEFTPDRIEKLILAYRQSLSFVATSYLEQGTHETKQRAYDSGVIKHSELLHYNKVGNQIFTETEKLRQSGGFDEKLPAMQDYELWIRMAKLHGDGLKTRDFTYVVHTEHESERISSKPNKLITAVELIQKKHHNDINKSHRKTHELLIQRARKEKITIPAMLKLVNRSNYRLVISSVLAQNKWRT